jgi:hypothetical protein
MSLLSNPVTLLVVLVLLLENNGVENFLFVFHHRETLCVRILGV